MACSDFDGQVVRQDNEIAKLAKQFVCVRIQSMNGVDINRFPFEFDLTWMSFFQDSDGRTYARYGGREDTGPETQLSQQSLARVMKQVLRLHESGKAKPHSRFEPAPEKASIPEQLPGMREMLARRKVKCIHCHDVKTAILKDVRTSGKLKKEMIFTFPSPLNLGIQLDPNDQRKIKTVLHASPAAAAGIQAGDTLKQLDGESILTFADATRVLELAPAAGKLPVQIERDEQVIETEILLTDRWRVSDDPSWRESTHVVGPNSGFWGVKLDLSQRKSQQIKHDQLALRITSIWGQWARNADIKQGDVLLSIDGQASDHSIRQVQTHLQMNKNWGDTIPLTVRRKGKRVNLKMTLPKQPND